VKITYSIANNSIQPPDQGLSELFIREVACDPVGIVRFHDM
jgi:hypothetical protein